MEELKGLAGSVIALTFSNEKRVEDLWLLERFKTFMKKNGVRRLADGDVLLWRLMQQIMSGDIIAAEDVPASAALKVRYWRTGRHYPKNRGICEVFGKALGLDKNEMNYLITAWFNRSDKVFDNAEDTDPEYLRRRAILKQLQKEFLDKQFPEDLIDMCAPGTLPQENLRFIYCRHAVKYLGNSVLLDFNDSLSHMLTRGYDFQFGREMKLIGDISRNAMIRHLLILGMPFVSVSRVNGWLEALGYMPLCKKHRQPGGAASDLLIEGLLEIYEKECTGKEPAACTEWFSSAARQMDDALDAAGCAFVNPFRFKHIIGGKDV